MTRLAPCCACQRPGPYYSGLPGILVGALRRRRFRIVERCDTCERFVSDEEAGEVYAAANSGSVRCNCRGRIIFIGS